MTLKAIGAALALAAAAAILLAWAGIGVLAGTALWDYRYVLLVVGTVLGLSLLDTALARIARWLEKRNTDRA